MDVISQYKEMHKQGHFPGLSVVQHHEVIGNLIHETGARSLLDYGSGKGEQYTRNGIHVDWGIMPYLYDPGCPGYERRPDQRFDGVICSDVAEHIPEDELDDFLEDVFLFAEKFVFFSICCRPAKKTLPDGRNCHLTVQSEGWWLERIQPPPGIKCQIEWNP